MAMLVASFFSWWYGRGWRTVWESFGPRLQQVADSFSVGQLLRTLFAPWRRIITRPGTGLEGKLRAWGDNLVSRAVGFMVRLVVLQAALLVVLAVGVYMTIELILWPLLPLLIPGLLIAGLII